MVLQTYPGIILMLYQNQPIWLKVRNAILNADPNSVAVTIFSQEVVNAYYTKSAFSNYDGGVLVSAKYDFVDILPDDVFRPNIGRPSVPKYGDSVLSYHLNVDYHIRQPFQESIYRFIIKYCADHGNPHCEMNFYTKKQAPYATTYNWDSALCQYLPPEHTFPMSAVQKVILQLDRDQFERQININEV